MAERSKDIRHPDPQEKLPRDFLKYLTFDINGEL
jgi:hypothetical protein